MMRAIGKTIPSLLPSFLSPYLLLLKDYVVYPMLLDESTKSGAPAGTDEGTRKGVRSLAYRNSFKLPMLSNKIQ